MRVLSCAAVHAGAWPDLAKLIPALNRVGLDGVAIEEATGIERVQQNRWATAASVRPELVWCFAVLSAQCDTLESNVALELQPLQSIVYKTISGVDVSRGSNKLEHALLGGKRSLAVHFGSLSVAPPSLATPRGHRPAARFFVSAIRNLQGTTQKRVTAQQEPHALATTRGVSNTQLTRQSHPIFSPTQNRARRSGESDPVCMHQAKALHRTIAALLRVLSLMRPKPAMVA